MSRVTTLLASSIALFATAVMAELLGGAGATPAATTWPPCRAPSLLGSDDLRNKLLVSACGQTKVFRGVNYPYSILLTNAGRVPFHRAKLTVTHYEPITRSSLPYRPEATESPYLPMHTSVWTIDQLKPGQTFRVGISLPFRQHNDPKGSNFVIGARTQDPKRSSFTKDVFFIRRSP